MAYDLRKVFRKAELKWSADYPPELKSQKLKFTPEAMQNI